MSRLAALVRRELGVYFVSPLAYITLTALLLISAVAFYGSVKGAVAARAPGDFQGPLFAVVMVVIFSSPLVTMRLIAEETSKGTIEILLTAPVTEAQVILSKFLATIALLVFLLAPTFGYALILARYGSVDFGQVFCGYLGVLLLGGALYSLGIFVSSLCSSQITAGLITFAAVILLLIANIVPVENPFLRQLQEFLNLGNNLGDFIKGVVDSSRLVYLLSISGFFLFLATRILETRRWR